MTNRQLFLQHLAQTSPAPVGIEIVKANGNYLHDADGNTYLDLIGGISVCNIGHSHPAVVAAITAQAQQYMHIMVYGELVQSPQSQYAQLLASYLPKHLDCVYFTNSGTEATEGALKLARRVTGRTDVVCAQKSYHGSTLGALSVMGDEYWRNAYRPLLPGIHHHTFNSPEFIAAIDHHTSCVIIETIQAEVGIQLPDIAWLRQLRQRCTDTGTLLIFDEIQCGFGRTGSLWAFQQYGVEPDVLLLGKALGGGMPMGAFVASHSLMQSLTHNPVLGHITTFGGHPVCCAAGMAGMQVLLQEQLIERVAAKEQLFHQLLVHPSIMAVRSKGLLLAVQLESSEKVMAVLQQCLTLGLFSDWFLFAPHCIRIAPPLTISESEIEFACRTLLSCL